MENTNNSSACSATWRRKIVLDRLNRCVAARLGGPGTRTRQWLLTGLAQSSASRLLHGTSSFDFLGYSFGPLRFRRNGHEYLGASPSKKGVAKLRQKVGDLLVRQNLAPWPKVRDQLNRILRGCSNYFGYGTRLMAYRAVDHYVYERVRHFLRHRHKVSSRGTTRFSIPVVFGEMGGLRLRD